MTELAPRARRRKPVTAGLAAALAAAGTGSALARAVGVTEGAISQWRGIPYKHVLKIEAQFGVHRSVLRPDVYPSAPDAVTGQTDAA